MEEGRGPGPGLGAPVEGPGLGARVEGRGPRLGARVEGRGPGLGARVEGRGPGLGARVLVLALLVLLSPRSGHAQKGDGCGPSVLGPSSGTLSSLGYPGTYPNHTVCEWEISVPRGHRIHFRFAELDIEETNCQVNYLRLYNGVGPQRKTMGERETAGLRYRKYCGRGLDVVQLINSTGNEVTVQFMSGSHLAGRGFYLSYSTTEHTDLITCLDKGTDFTEAEYSKYCPAGCLNSFEEVSGTVPNGYRESSPLCAAAVHAGVVSNLVGGRISVVSSKGIPHYEGTLANNVTSTGGSLSNSLFTFKTSGCYGTLGLESGGVANSQLSASSAYSEWAASGARLKKTGLPWATDHSDLLQWLQVDLKREKRITGISTTGSTLREYAWYVSAYRVLYSSDGQNWLAHREGNSTQDKIFQGNTNYAHEVRNNFIPPIEARYVRICPTQWHHRISLKLELLGCPLPTVEGWPPIAVPRIIRPVGLPRPSLPPPVVTNTLPHSHSTHTPDIRNTTMPPHTSKDVALIAVLVPVLVMALTALILTVVCAWHWKSRKASTEETYDLPHWDRTDWWKSMKQLLPSKMAERDDSVRYSSDVGRLRGRVIVPGHHPESAEYAQPLVSGAVTSLGARSTFKPEESPAPGYGDPELYDAPISPDVYHAYAEPLPASGSEYATPIVIDKACHIAAGAAASHPVPAVSSFMGGGGGGSGGGGLHLMLPKADGGKPGRSAYDTPKSANGQATPTEELTYQVPQNGTQKATGQG
ncbi:Discoidin, CUB and LCCL domain-containing protein 2 [Merluccius polli]|uniref:Discoidin, CUB and LCCL domain-containing protein 2 n=1 Tax=Merluccius polli TaxID=89951 RepID=A0AA47MUX3_MERPO|nr:Discoidin, CUB and LCCL domain-containing protein 2 [Merluccius polli]